MTDEADKTVLAVDYGRRRIGLAKTDPLRVIASAFRTVEVRSPEQAVKAVQQAIVETNPSALVVGYPTHWSGEISDTCREIDEFIARLKLIYPGPIYKVDEYGTSSEAADIVHAHGKKTGKNKGRIDTLAAVAILQRFLNGEYEDETGHGC